LVIGAVTLEASLGQNRPDVAMKIDALRALQPCHRKSQCDQDHDSTSRHSQPSSIQKKRESMAGPKQDTSGHAAGGRKPDKPYGNSANRKKQEVTTCATRRQDQPAWQVHCLPRSAAIRS